MACKKKPNKVKRRLFSIYKRKPYANIKQSLLIGLRIGHTYNVETEALLSLLLYRDILICLVFIEEFQIQPKLGNNWMIKYVKILIKIGIIRAISLQIFLYNNNY